MITPEGIVKDISPLLQETNITHDHISIVETKGMYPYKENIEDNWAFFTAVGFERVQDIFKKEGYTVKDTAVVGIGSGVEGITALYLFKDTLETLIVTDVDEEVLDGTMVNIKDTAVLFDKKVIPLMGSFCEPIEKGGYHVDLIHANIPNLPAEESEDLSKGAEKGTFLRSSLYEGYNPPEKFVGWAMGAQYAYLESAKNVLRPGATVITELGGRMPLALMSELFETCGFEFQEVYVGFKEQTEALIDFIGYHRMEEQYGVTFEFYIFDESKKALKDVGFTNVNSTISGAEIKKILEPYKVSAGKALELHKQGVAVGHTVHILRGVKKS
jgi:methylase of polypeptide subunit release factors